MKRLQRFIVATTLAGITTFAGAASATDVIGGNPIANRQVVDTRQDFFLLDTNQPFRGEGRLRHWEIFAETTNPVQLVIYRQVGGVFLVVGASGVEIPAVGYNLFAIFPRIGVERGDFIGVYHPGTGSVSYTLDPPGTDEFSDLTGTVLFTGQGAGPTAFTGSSYRRYSIRAFR